MELSGSNIKKFLIFSQKKAFLIFWETKILKKFVIFQETELSYISGNGNRNPKKLLIFLEMSPPPKKKANLVKLSMLEQPLLFIGCSSIQFLNSPPFLNTVSQNTFGTLPLTVQ